jgi:predicted nuclease of predicted toxin-antitoxin system
LKILIDMNLPPALVEALREDGFEARHWLETGNPRATDREILEWAERNGFLLLTHDLGFGAILAATRGRGPSVLQARTQDVSPGRIVPLVRDALRQYARQLEQGALVSLDESRTRARILPLRG